MKKLLCFLYLLMMIGYTSLFAQTDLQNGLLLFYPLNGNVTDLSGNGLDGTIHGNPVLTTDRFGSANSAYLFDGNGDFISMPASALLPSTYSYSLWVNPSSNLGVQAIISIGTSNSSTTNDQDILLSFNDGWIGGAFKNSGTFFTISTGTLPTLNSWYHLVLTRDNSKIQFYINGVFVGSGQVGEAPDYGTDPTAFLAKRSGTNLQYFSGGMDDVKIYNRVLNSEEVSALFTSLQVLSVSHSNSDNHLVNVSPNPSNGTFKLDFPGSNGPCDITIQNSLGQIVYFEKLESMSSNVEFNLIQAPKGIYLLTVKSDLGWETERLIIQ